MKLFLSSYFKCVATLFSNYAECAGKKVAFIPTASNFEKVNFYVEADKKALVKLGLIVEELDISSTKPVEIRNKIEACDYVFVEGGNTFYLLQEIKRSGADKMILEHIQKNKIYIGASAGSMIMSKSIEYAKHMDDPTRALELNGDYSSLGVVNFYIVPHYTNVPFKKAADRIIKEYSDYVPLYPISNNQAVVVDGDRIEVITV
ncbi:MAG: peptidase E [Clostridia bacterium]|nr:peptidase E [Clostridia bacterium]